MNVSKGFIYSELPEPEQIIPAEDKCLEYIKVNWMNHSRVTDTQFVTPFLHQRCHYQSSFWSS